MAEMELATLICGEIAGTLRQDEHGLCSFVYAPTYRGTPLSLTMPLSNRTYGHNIVRPFLFGLLPDSQEQRRAIAAEHDVASNNPSPSCAISVLTAQGPFSFVEPIN